MFDYRDFLDIARQHVGYNAGDASHRTAIGRAYYSAFLHARTCEEQRNKSPFPMTPDVHRLVLNCLKASYPREAKDLEDLRRLRNRADYDLYYSNASDDVQDAIDRAHNLITRVKRPSDEG